MNTKHRMACAGTIFLSSAFALSCGSPATDGGEGGTTSNTGGASAGRSSAGANASGGVAESAGGPSGAGGLAGVAGVYSGVGGSTADAGAGASVAGAADVGSCTGGIAGWSGSAGANAGGVAGLAGAAGSNAGGVAGFAGVAGSNAGGVGGLAGNAGGVGGLAGSNTGGSGGVAAGGNCGFPGPVCAGATGASGEGGLAGSNSGGSGGVAAGGNCGFPGPVCAGATGASGEGGSGGSNGDPSASLTFSTQALYFSSLACGEAPSSSSSRTFTITNPSSVTKVWRALFVGEAAQFFSVDPSSASLLPGATVTVTVTPLLIPTGSVPLLHNNTGAIVITANSQVQGNAIALYEQISGAFFSSSPQDLNFGIVPLNTSVDTWVPPFANNHYAPFSDNAPSFTATWHPAPDSLWSVHFVANAPFIQRAKFTWQPGGPYPAVCTPNTFTATAVVSVPGGAGCSAPGVPPGTPCGTYLVCSGDNLGACVTELTIAGSTVSAPPGSAVSGVIATGTIAVAPSATLLANTNWGDDIGQDSRSSITLGNGGFNVSFSVNGTHKYANTGTYEGTVTVRDPLTQSSASAKFTVIN